MLDNIAVRNTLLFIKLFSHYLIIKQTLARVISQQKIDILLLRSIYAATYDTFDNNTQEGSKLTRRQHNTAVDKK